MSANTGPDDRVNRQPQLSLRLRPTLLAVLLGLLVATVGSIGAIAFFKTSESIETLAHQQFAAVTKATGERVQSLVAGVPRVLLEYELMAQRGLLPIDDQEALGMQFVERLRQNPEMAWIGFGDARNGHFVGATRRSGSGVRLYAARPDVGGGLPVEPGIERSGGRTQVKSDEDMPYRVTEKGWFQQAMDMKGLGWLAPYAFTDGREGVTAILPLTLRGGTAPMGVLHVDLFIDNIDEFLDGLAIGKTGRVHLLGRAGNTVAAPTIWRNGDPALNSALNQLANGLPQVPAMGVEDLEYRHDGETWRASFAQIGIPNGPDWIVAVVAPEKEFTGVAVENAWWTLGAGLAALLLAALIAILVSSRIAVPLRRISEDLEKLAVFSFDDRPLPTSFVREVAVVGQTVKQMKSSLRSFGRYVPTDLVRELLASGREAELGGERQRLTIHFSDIAGFTSISENLTPEKLVEELGDYFGTMREVLRTHHGTIDKYMGDGILAFFNAPKAVRGHEVHACLAALEAQQRLTDDRAVRRASGRPEFSARIGLEVGEVIVGNIGTPDRFAYTVIGDAVNLASRLEGLCKYYGTAIIGTGDLKAATGRAFEWRHLDRVAVVGRMASTDVYELIARSGELSKETAARRDAYEAALADYFAGRFTEAAAGFGTLAKADPKDMAVALLAQRCEELRRNPPAGQWTGVYAHTSK